MWQDKVTCVGALALCKARMRSSFFKPCISLCDAHKITVKITKRISINPEAGQLFYARLCTSWSFLSFISKYSCLALFPPLASLCLLSFASTHFPSFSCLSSSSVASFLHHLASPHLPPSSFFLFFPYTSLFCLLHCKCLQSSSLQLPPSPL